MCPWCQAEVETVTLVPRVLAKYPTYSFCLVAGVTSQTPMFHHPSAYAISRLEETPPYMAPRSES